MSIYKRHGRKIISFSPQPRQREGQGQAQPEDIRGGPEVEDEAVTGPVARARGHHPKEEHDREETAQTDREVKQCGGKSEPDMEQRKPAQVRKYAHEIAVLPLFIVSEQ